jgi:hypothetical protein
MRRILLALGAAAVALGLVACGGVSEQLDPLALSAQKSADAGGVKMHLVANFAVSGQSMSLGADGIFDGDEGELTMNLGDILGSAGLPGGSGEARVIVTKDGDHPVMYLRMPELSGMLGGGKAWIKMDLSELMEQYGKNGGGGQDLFGAAGQSPADALELLKKVASVTEVGTETIDGDATTHYHATVDIAEALESMGGNVPADALAAIKNSGLSTDVPVDVWVGKDDGYVHRLRITYDAAASGESVKGDMTMTFSDWGTDVSIDVPGDDEVFDATQLLAGLGGKP